VSAAGQAWLVPHAVARVLLALAELPRDDLWRLTAVQRGFARTAHGDGVPFVDPMRALAGLASAVADEPETARRLAGEIDAALDTAGGRWRPAPTGT